MKLLLEQIVLPNFKIETKNPKTRYNIILMYDGFYTKVLTVKMYVL